MRLRGPRTLRNRIILWLLAFATALTLAIVVQGTVVIEYVERAVWKSLLTIELDHFVEKRARHPDYQWDQADGLMVYTAADDARLPVPLQGLAPGLHDDLWIDDNKHVALVQDMAGSRYTLAMDIDQFSSSEAGFEWLTVAAAVLLLLAVSLAAMFGVRRLLQPLSRLAAQIGQMRPGTEGKPIGLDAHAGSELVVIADAFNDYQRRNAEFVQRERTFINTASHELRTPVAVINGAAELALQAGDDRAAVHHQLQRIQRSASEMEQLITLLLALANDRSRLSGASRALDLRRLLPQIVEDHQHLTAGKALQLELAAVPDCPLSAPPGIFRATVGNLLRNAIENSDNGTIHIALHGDGTLVIRDPGHGMTPEQISEIYTRMARGEGGRGDSGIGLELIARLCEHAGWRLQLDSQPAQGTTATLCFRTDPDRPPAA